MRILLITFFTILSSCSGSDDPTNSNGENPPSVTSYEVTEAFPNLSFNRPVDLQHPGDDSGQLFVIEQSGVVRVFENNASVENSSVFLDIQSQVDDSGNEEGLLGLAFHPNYETNGYFYVNYTADNPDRTVIAQFQVSQQMNPARLKFYRSSSLSVTTMVDSWPLVPMDTCT